MNKSRGQVNWAQALEAHSKNNKDSKDRGRFSKLNLNLNNQSSAQSGNSSVTGPTGQKNSGFKPSKLFYDSI